MRLQAFEGFARRAAARRLWYITGTVPVQAETLERAQDRVGRAGLLARLVEVFDAHEPLPFARRASSQLASAATSEPKCSGPVGDGREPAYVHGCLEYTARHCNLIRERMPWRPSS